MVLTVTLPSSFPFPSQNEDDFFSKPLLFSSSVVVHSHYSVQPKLPFNENEDFSAGKDNVFWFSAYVDPGLFDRDHLSTWRWAVVIDAAHEGIDGLAPRAG